MRNLVSWMSYKLSSHTCANMRSLLKLHFYHQQFPNRAHNPIKGKPTKKYVKDLHLSFCTAARGGELVPQMPVLWYESCDDDEKLMDFYLYQPDDHRPCYFYYFFKKGIGAAWIWRHIFTECLRFIGTGATKTPLLSKADKLSPMQFTM